MKFLVVFLGICLGMVSCKKDEIDFEGWTEAVIYYSGAVEVDGCGWLLLIDGISYHPTNLDEAFMIDELAVWIKFNVADDSFYCGRGGTPFESLEILDIMRKEWVVQNLSEEMLDDLSLDMFWIDTIYLDGDSLRFEVSSSGGCKIHQYNLWKLPENKNKDIELLLEHDANDDMCEAIVHASLSYSLVPLRERGKNELVFLMRGSPIMSSYYGEFVYRW